MMKDLNRGGRGSYNRRAEVLYSYYSSDRDKTYQPPKKPRLEPPSPIQVFDINGNEILLDGDLPSPVGE